MTAQSVLAFGRYTCPMTDILRPHTASLSSSSSSSSSSSLFCCHPSDMRDEELRRISFSLFPKWSAASVESLIEAAFYYTGDSDKVRCPECELTYSNWTSQDDPTAVHLRLKPQCSLIRGIAGSALSAGVDEASATSASARRRAQKNRRRNNNRTNHSPTNVGRYNLQTDGPDEGAMLEHAAPPRDNLPTTVMPRSDKRRNNINPADINPYESTAIAERLETYKGKWPEDCPMKVDDLAKAGFVYKGPEDRVQCVYCKGIIFKWESKDTPIGEHTRHFPDCAFIAKVTSEAPKMLQLPAAQVLLNMGCEEFKVEKILAKLIDDGIDEPSTSQLVDALFDLEDELAALEVKKMEAKRQRQKEVPSEAVPEEVRLLREENQQLKDSNVCKVCRDSPVQTLLLPCRHLVCCSECASKVNFCPMCRAKIVGTVRTYFS